MSLPSHEGKVIKLKINDRLGQKLGTNPFKTTMVGKSKETMNPILQPTKNS